MVGARVVTAPARSNARHDRPVGDRTVVRAAATALGLGVAVVLGTAVLARVLDAPNAALTREPQMWLGGAWYVGAMASVTTLGWTVGAASAGLAAAVVRRGRAAALFAGASVLTTLLLLDDLFSLHEDVYPRIGLGEGLVQGAYLLGVLTLLLGFRAELGRRALLALGVAVGCWGASAILDRSHNLAWFNFDQLGEDGAKLLGVFIWSATWAALAAASLAPRSPAGRT